MKNLFTLLMLALCFSLVACEEKKVEEVPTNEAVTDSPTIDEIKKTGGEVKEDIKEAGEEIKDDTEAVVDDAEKKLDEAAGEVKEAADDVAESQPGE